MKREERFAILKELMIGFREEADDAAGEAQLEHLPADYRAGCLATAALAEKRLLAIVYTLAENRRLRKALDLRGELIDAVRQAGWGVHAYNSPEAVKRGNAILSKMEEALTWEAKGCTPSPKTE